MKAYVVLLAILAVGVAPTGANSKVALRVSPAVAFAPADLTVRTTVETDAANRSLQIIAESDDFYRSSEVQLEGDDAPRTQTISFRSMPGGDYTVRVIVRGSRGEMLATTSTAVNIVERGR
jgi:hypothetical protein